MPPTDFLPHGAWFGLRPRRSRLLLNLAAWAFGLVLFAYLSCYAYLRYELHRTTMLLQKLQTIQIGQSEQSVRSMFLSYEDERANRGLGYKPDAHIFFLDPWKAYSGFRWNWTNRLLAFMLSGERSLRRALGLRVWLVFGEYGADQGKITLVSAAVVVEGRNEWLKGDWTYVAEFRRQDATRGDANNRSDQMQRFRSHWAHLHMGDGTGEVLVNVVLATAKPEELNAARSFNLSCLMSFPGCRSLCELMPAAADYRRARGYGRLGWNPGSWGPQDHSCE